MSQFKVLYKAIPWHCDCCGSGEHGSLTLYEKIFDDFLPIWSGSYNDQFGGVLREGDKEIKGVYESFDNFASGFKTALEALGHTVELYDGGRLVK